MNAGQIRRLLEDWPDAMPVLLKGPGYNYRPANASVVSVLKDEDGYYSEDLGEDVTPEKFYGHRIKGIVIQ